MTNMDEIDIEKIKEIEFNILCYIDDFCNKNNIKYYLAYGTLLGAVRHKNFIPWDDDVDIYMPRKDYDRFIDLFNKSISNYHFVCIENNKNYYLPFGKVYDKRTSLIERTPKPLEIGVFVDIYPLENIPGNYDKACEFIQRKKITYLYKIFIVKNRILFKKRPLSKNILLFIAKLGTLFIKREWVIKKIVKSLSKYKNCDTEYVFSLCLINSTKDIFRSEYFKSNTKLTFNNREFSVPNNYDAVLKGIYNNYMDLPPVEKRVSHHDYCVSLKK